MLHRLTKRGLIDRILHGPFTVERGHLARSLRLTIAADRKQKSAVIIALAPAVGSGMQKYDVDSAYAVVNEKVIMLTRLEARRIAWRLRQSLRIHAETPSPHTSRDGCSDATG